jgi:hypothetical protein
MAVAFAAAFLSIPAVACYQLFTGTGSYWRGHDDRFVLRGEVFLVVATAFAAFWLLRGAHRALVGKYRMIQVPMLVLLVVGSIGQTVDVVGGGITGGHLVRFAILAAAGLTVALTRTRSAQEFQVPPPVT